MKWKYDKRKIYDCLVEFINKTISEPSLKDSVLNALKFKLDDFIFSKLTYAHFCIWSKDEKLEDQVKIMASVESFVLACDILDDLQDMDTFDVPWMEIENKFSMDVFYVFMSLPDLLIQSTTLSSDLKIQLLEIFAKFKMNAVNGQHKSLQRQLMTEEEYLKMIESKSGSFMAFACLFGSIHASIEERKQIESYAIHIGCSAQIENDLLGISEKKNYKDIYTKEISLSIIYLLEFTNSHSIPLNEYYNNKLDKEQLIISSPDLKESIDNSGAIIYTRCMQSIQLEKACLIIDGLYPNEADRNLIKNIVYGQES